MLTDNLTVGAGYDLGLRAKGAFASVQVSKIVSDRDVSGRAIYFHDGNVVRTEASVKIDSRSHLSAA